ncbi:protein of unknown function [Paraburkholderia dioscoreae]|uniref:Uncharacterized protein n=1 Tax=Paraburkholderia dioscoreae TaxID=2604047 RepID=A0A5Q4ZTK5_9BURK|nr:protein of unknown function [Paraburkholderia dioscoreae]
MIKQEIEAELSSLLERFENVKTLHGQRAAVRNGHLPEREVLIAAGPVAVDKRGRRSLCVESLFRHAQRLRRERLRMARQRYARQQIERVTHIQSEMREFDGMLGRQPLSG